MKISAFLTRFYLIGLFSLVLAFSLGLLFQAPSAVPARAEVLVGPVAQADSAVTGEDSSVLIRVLDNDTGLDNTPLTVTLEAGPQYGTADLIGNQHFRYLPAADYFGQDGFIYQVCDAAQLCSSAGVSVTITPTNDLPSAQPDSETVDEDGNVVTQVLLNDLGLGDGSLSVTLLVAPQHGSAAVETDLSISYTPNPDFNGSDSYTYQVCDANADCSSAPVSLAVSPVDDTPLASADNSILQEDSQVTVSVLANDSGLGDQPLTVTVSVLPVHGVAQANPDNTVTYRPSPNFAGADSFRYQVCDSNNDCPTAVVSLSISPVNDPPSAVDDALTTMEDTSATIAVLANDVDIDGDALLLASFQAVSAQGGSVVRADAGTPTDTSDDRLVYTPQANYNGSDSFTYTASDGSFTSTAQVVITVQVVHDAPIANNDTFQVDQGFLLTIPAASGVLSNDVNREGTSLTARLVSNPVSGTLTLGPDGAFSYTPSPGFSGADTFSYKAFDGTLESNLAVVSITVNAVEALQVVNDEYSTSQGTPLTVVAPGVLANDNNGKITGITAVVAAQPAYGTLAFNPNGAFTYTPTAGFVGADTFSYTITEGGANSPPALVTLNVLDTQPPLVDWVSPVASGERYNANGGFIHLGATASDNVAVSQVRFYWWNAQAGQYQDIATLTAPPYTVSYFNTSLLNPGWNNLFVKSYDAAGNESERQWIWIFLDQASSLLVERIFLPILFR